jgi:hypothetical protein
VSPKGQNLRKLVFRNPLDIVKYIFFLFCLLGIYITLCFIRFGDDHVNDELKVTTVVLSILIAFIANRIVVRLNKDNERKIRNANLSVLINGAQVIKKRRFLKNAINRIQIVVKNIPIVSFLGNSTLEKIDHALDWKMYSLVRSKFLIELDKAYVSIRNRFLIMVFLALAYRFVLFMF